MAIAESRTATADIAVAAPAAQPRRPRRGWPLIWPALIYALIVTQIPFLLTIWYSFQRWNLNRPKQRGFIGFDNYKVLLTRDPSFWPAMLNTLIIVVGSVVLALALGMLFAELVNHPFPGRGIVRTMFITPFLIMPTVAALTWKNQMLNPNFGVLDWFLSTALPGTFAPNWLGEWPKFSVMLVFIWRWAPFMMLILLAGMQSISEEVREAARVDGASGWQEFRDITLPHMNRFIQLGALLGTVFIVNEIDPIYILTRGGPGDVTTTLPYLVYKKAREAFNVGMGAALGVIVVILANIVIALLLRALNRILQQED
ncbi:MAG: sugar ABC transporter permease [Thermomicrobiales bacterium]|nr:sugar ABC transporter permease [Thermomicrobiales bacterium]